MFTAAVVYSPMFSGNMLSRKVRSLEKIFNYGHKAHGVLERKA